MSELAPSLTNFENSSFGYCSAAGEAILSQFRTTQKLIYSSLSVGGALLAKLGEASEEAAEENWDGEDGASVNLASLKAAEDFARALPIAYADPEVSIDREGDVCFDWGFCPLRTFTVSIDSDGKLYYAGFFGSERHRLSGCETFHDTVPQEILAKLQRLFS